MKKLEEKKSVRPKDLKRVGTEKAQVIKEVIG